VSKPASVRPPSSHARRVGPKPVIGVSACLRPLGPVAYHAVQARYVDAVAAGTGAQPVLIPALGEDNLDRLLELLDGVLITGSPSNIEPRHYGNRPNPRAGPHDPMRDRTTLPLIRTAVETGVPVLGICRGCQEMNVAFGGTLHTHLHELEGRFDHRADRRLPLDEVYGPRHSVRFVPGGLIATAFGHETAMVNSLHSQGLERLGAGLVVEATADDGTIEAIRHELAPAFALGVQWHVEWKLRENPLSKTIFGLFDRAVRARARDR
jgi:putative glutamine amidotransferase